MKTPYLIQTVRPSGGAKEYGSETILGAIAWAARAFEKGGYSRIEIIRAADREVIKIFQSRKRRPRR